jgi:hypothetical protein
MALYGGFSFGGYSNVTYRYDYSVSAGHLSGLLPAVLLSMIYVCAILYFHAIFSANLNKALYESSELEGIAREKTSTVQMIDVTTNVLPAETTSDSSLKATEAIEKSSSQRWASHIGGMIGTYSTFVFLALANCIIVSIVNGLYISAYLSLNITNIDLFFISIALSIFKLGWTRYVVPSLVSAVSNEQSSQSAHILERGIIMRSVSSVSINNDIRSEIRNQSFLVAITIFNTIIVPCLAVIVVSPQALLYIFTTPESVETTFDIPNCVVYDLLSTSNGTTSYSCYQYSTTPQPISFSPPFAYTYGGSMALLQAYASVFTYMFAIATFVSPALTVLLLSIISRLRLRRGSWQFDLIADFLPQMYLPPESLGKWRTVNRIRNYIVSSLGSSVSHNTVSDRKDIPMLPQQLKLQSQQSEDSDIRQTSIQSPIADSELKIRYVNTLGESKHNYSSDTKVDVVSNRSEAAAMLSLSQRSSRLPKSIFNTKIFILQMAQLMCVIFSFGMAFPPLAVLGFVAIWSKMSFVQMMIKTDTETKTDKDKDKDREND